MGAAALIEHNKGKFERSKARFVAAMESDTLEEALACYTVPASFWRAARKYGLAEEAREKYRDDLPPTDEERQANLIEDAEWLARTGEHPLNAAKRLGFNRYLSLERALERAGRLDISVRLRANDGLQGWGGQGGIGERAYAPRVSRGA